MLGLSERCKELDKIIKELAFAAAIGVDDTSDFDGLDPENIIIEAGYDGPHLPTPVTAESVIAMTEKFKDGKKVKHTHTRKQPPPRLD